MITNGWAYIAFGIATLFKIQWLMAVAGGYIAFLYFPLTLEKIVTVPLAIFFQMKLFPRDKKLYAQLQEMKKEVFKEYFNLKFKLKWNKHKKWLI